MIFRLGLLPLAETFRSSSSIAGDSIGEFFGGVFDGDFEAAELDANGGDCLRVN